MSRCMCGGVVDDGKCRDCGMKYTVVGGKKTAVFSWNESAAKSFFREVLGNGHSV